MKQVLLIAVILSFGFVLYEAFFGGTASPRIVVSYIAASSVALALSMIAKSWAARIKWAWVALSLVVIYAVVTGMMVGLQFA